METDLITLAPQQYHQGVTWIAVPGGGGTLVNSKDKTVEIQPIPALQISENEVHIPDHYVSSEGCISFKIITDSNSIITLASGQHCQGITWLAFPDGGGGTLGNTSHKTVEIQPGVNTVWETSGQHIHIPDHYVNPQDQCISLKIV